MELELAGESRSRWGEGPIWWGEALYFVDIEGHLVHRHTPGDGRERTWDVGQRVGTVVPREGGGLVIAGDDGFAYLDEASGALTPIADPEAEKKPDNRFNDGKCSPDGRLFAGTISLVKKKGNAALYRLDPDGTVTRVYAGVTNSNGIVWSADGGTMFYIDTPRLAVLAFDYDAADGSIGNERTAFSTEGRVPGVPDGMAIDADGNLWVAFCHGACVVCFDPGGKELQRIELPCREVTAPAFGGADLSDLYITTGIPKEEVEDEAGRLFVARGLGARGVPANAFGG
ncbi:MAG: SMP-30/gluconolactonase/LRE family protein [Akkermansiaceae bacterium]|nr:SMP-30/gluconolactonase/LRE family protein [Akkermansiaceae bacterium]